MVLICTLWWLFFNQPSISAPWHTGIFTTIPGYLSRLVSMSVNILYLLWNVCYFIDVYNMFPPHIFSFSLSRIILHFFLFLILHYLLVQKTPFVFQGHSNSPLLVAFSDPCFLQWTSFVFCLYHLGSAISFYVQ